MEYFVLDTGEPRIPRIFQLPDEPMESDIDEGLGSFERR